MTSNSDDEQLTQATFTSFLISFAGEWAIKKDLQSRLASSLIYANLAEFFADDLIDSIKTEMNHKLIESRVKLEPPSVDIKTNLERSITTLKTFQFPKKSEIIQLLIQIKENRNSLFHALLVLHLKDLDIDLLITTIAVDVEKFLSIYFSITPEFPYKNKFIKLAHEVALEKRKA